MKKIILAFVVLFITLGYSQTTQKKYKYILVPLQYGFTTEPNQYQLNILTRVMLKKEGFEVYMSQDEKKPLALSKNQCLALKANVLKDSGIFVTKLIFQLKDCFGKTVFESIGESREKAYKVAYQEALKNALLEFQMVSNSYLKTTTDEEQPNSVINPENKTEDIKTIPFEDKADTYSYNNTTYWLLKNDENYVLYLDKGKTVLATIELVDRGTYAYDSADIDGAAYFNADGDIIVEFLEKDKDAVQKIIYKKQ